MITQNILIGRARRSVGYNTALRWRGLNVIRGKALTVTNPNTPAQQAQRLRMSQIMHWGQLVAPVTNVGFKYIDAQKKTARNVAISKNYNPDLFNSGTHLLDNPEHMVISTGAMPSTMIDDVTMSGTKATVEWAHVDYYQPLQAGSDIAFACAIGYGDDITLQLVSCIQESSRTRSELFTKIECQPLIDAGFTEAVFYLFFQSASNKRIISTSFCDVWTIV